MIAKFARRSAAVVALMLASAGAAHAQTQVINFTVAGINQFALTSGGALAMTVNTATAGSDPTPATDATTSWAFTTNQTGMKVAAKIDIAMPGSVKLNASLAGPGGATMTAVDLSTTNQDVVTGLTKAKGSAFAITYTLSSTVTDAPATGARTVTYTVTPGT